MGAHVDRPFKDAPRRFVFIWSVRPNAERCHIVKKSEVSSRSGRLVVEAACGDKFDLYETSPYPNRDHKMCERCDKERER